jgi:hypothetical protein
MRSSARLILVAAFAAALALGVASQTGPDPQWGIHDVNRPLPTVLDPGPALLVPVAVPPGAAVLFDGTDLSKWADSKGGPAKWKVEKGYFEVVPKTGGIQTRDSFGSCHLHVEWASPSPAKGRDQDRGNSGVFLMNTYEVQVLDSFENRTYADGMAGAVYGQYPPLFNVCRKPGEWQTFDIIFLRPFFDNDGKVVRPARMTVMHNGIVVQSYVAPTGPTAWKARPPYKVHADKLPISLQDHGHPVRFRNFWIREIAE